jgi:regulator of protease activity HflC (stomatin/prohibitin superfamily)
MTLARLILLVAPVVLTQLGACSTVIGPGQTGVLWRASNGTQHETYGEGLHAVAPWNQLYVYDLRSMSRDEVLSVIAVNGLSIKLDTSVRYHLLPAEVVAMHEELGPDYYQKVLEPVLRSEARRAFGQYTPEEIYSTKRDVIEREIRQGVIAKVAGRHIALEAILIRDVELPVAIRTAIDRKLAAEQEVLKMKYVIAVAKQTAEQRQIEADSVAGYNRTVASSLSPEILEYARIQQMTQLAASTNAKTIVMGAGGPATAPIILTTPSGGAR